MRSTVPSLMACNYDKSLLFCMTCSIGNRMIIVYCNKAFRKLCKLIAKQLQKSQTESLPFFSTKQLWKMCNAVNTSVLNMKRKVNISKRRQLYILRVVKKQLFNNNVFFQLHVHIMYLAYEFFSEESRAYVILHLLFHPRLKFWYILYFRYIFILD